MCSLLSQLYRGMVGRRDANEWRTYITHYATIINSVCIRGFLARKRAQHERASIALSWQWLGSHTSGAHIKYKQLLPRNKYAVTSTKEGIKYKYTQSASMTSNIAASSIVYGVATDELPGGAAFINYDRHGVGACSKVSVYSES
jgi:hypothetical protein